VVPDHEGPHWCRYTNPLLVECHLGLPRDREIDGSDCDFSFSERRFGERCPTSGWTDAFCSLSENSYDFLCASREIFLPPDNFSFFLSPNPCVTRLAFVELLFRFRPAATPCGARVFPGVVMELCFGCSGLLSFCTSRFECPTSYAALVEVLFSLSPRCPVIFSVISLCLLF